MEFEKLAQEKTEMQRHYVMVGYAVSSSRSLTVDRNDPPGLFVHISIGGGQWSELSQFSDKN